MKSDWKQLSFEEVLEDCSGGNPKVLQSSYQASGKIAVVDQGQDLIAGYVDDFALMCKAKCPNIIFGDHTRIFKFVDFPFCLGADGVKVLRPKIEADTKFLYHYLKSLQIPEAGYSRHYKFLKRMTVILPLAEEQRRIAAILDQAEALRAKRRQALAKLDTLTQSLFLEMFGDPALNRKNWPIKRFGDVATKFSDGPFGSNLKSEHYVLEGVRVIRLQNIGVGEFVDDDRAYISPRHAADLKKHACVAGDVLVGTLGDPNLRACIQPNWLQTAINKADCVQVRADPKQVTAEWIVGLLNNPTTEQMASGLILGQTRARIAMGRLRELQVPVPPLNLQTKYAKICSSYAEEREKFLANAALQDRLFASLQHRAFRGEL